MSNTIRNGEIKDIPLLAGESIAISSITGTYSATVTRGTSAGTVLATNSSGGATFGPYASGAVVRVTADADSSIDYSTGVTPVNAYDQNAKYSFDASGNVTGLVGPSGGSLPITYSPAAKLSALGAKPIGFNYYSLIYEILLSTISATSANRTAQLAYIKSTGANMVRVALPCFSSAEYLTIVHSTAQMPATMNDSNIRTSYIAALDAAFDAAAANGLKLHVCDFWGQSILPIAQGETLTTAYTTTNTKTAVYAKSATQWLFSRYKDHPAFGVYSIGNEYVYDETGAAAPTSTQWGIYFSYLADAARAINPSKIITTDLSAMGANVIKTRPTPDNVSAIYGRMFAGLDAWTLHFYSDGFNFTGHNTATNSTFPNTNATTLGYEGMSVIVGAFAAMASAQGKPLIVGEFGVSTANEADASYAKKRKLQKAVSQYASYAMWWNVQDATLAAGAGQSTWYIAASGTRSTTFLDIASEGNAARPAPAKPSVGLKSLKAQFHPTSAMTNGTGRVASSVLSATSTAAHSATNYAVLFWLKINASLNAFEVFINARGASNFNGLVSLGDSTGATSAYTEFRAAAGGAGNTNGTNPDLVVGEWNHFAVAYEALNGNTSITSYVNGLFWKSITASGVLGAIPVATSMKFLGDTSGAPISMQDITICQSVTPDDVIAHMQGNVLRQSMLHIRAFPNGGILDLSPSALTLTNGGVTVVNE
jgi:hypothetical protein